jgi:spore germination protein YaaH
MERKSINKKLRKIISIIIISAYILLLFPAYASQDSVTRFSDVPEGHWADKVIHDLRLLKITEGIGNNEFGLGLTISRSEFVTYLVRLMRWELITPENGSFPDNANNTKWYYPYIETAFTNGVIPKNSDKFRPEEPITREEMAIMIVHTLGYDELAKELTYLGNPFNDVENNTGYITIARDFGIVNGVGNNLFKPYNTATREEAAAMMIRMYDKVNQSLNELNAFYAIQSISQADMIPCLDSVGFGWSRLEYDEKNQQVVLNISRENNNNFAIPTGFSEPFNIAHQNKVCTQLMVFADNETKVNVNEKTIPLLEHILVKPEIRSQAITSIVGQVNTTTRDDITVSFDGVVIDFEGMKGELLKESLNTFLIELNQELNKTNKKLYVAVHPKRKPEQIYYDGYDYRTIGEIADRVILMAHDYYAKKLTEEEMNNGYTFTPLSPMDEVYYALKAITDKDTGVQNLEKIMLQISFDSVQWKLKDGKIINQYPYNPSYDAIYKRLLTDVTMNYDNISQNPYVTFYDSKDETNNVLWYEDSRSLEAKINLAKMFGIRGISLWRLGNIPNFNGIDEKETYLDVWQKILRKLEKS